MKNNSLKRSVLFCFSLICIVSLWKCANPVMPAGGEKDITPPKADSLITSPPLALRFTKKPIRFKFDEWVTLDNVQTQLVVSPPLFYPPKVTLKGKTVEFNFSEKEILKPNTTYSIQFGTSVKDITEGNVVPNLRYVFSTGDEIDKAEVYGAVRNAYKQEYSPEVSVLLYSSLSDSSFLKGKPDYFAKTAKDGTFAIQNVSPGNYKIYALTDENSNYHYDLETELIGFSDSLLPVVKDQSRKAETILISKEIKPARLIEKNLKQPGVISLGFTSDPKDIKYTIQDVGQKYIVEKDMDTIKVWYAMQPPVDWNIYVQSASKNDTLKIKSIIPQGKTIRKLINVSQKRSLGNSGITPTEPLLLDFSNPLVSIDSTKIMVTMDSIIQKNININIEKDKPRRLSFFTKWKEEKTYKIKLLPGALTDLYGSHNDTINYQIKVLSPKELGNVSIHVTNMSEKKHYILELYKDSPEPISRYFVNGVIKWDKKLANLVSGQYDILIIEDANENGIWDPVDLKTKRQPEPLYRKRTEPLRPNWELDVNLSL